MTLAARSAPSIDPNLPLLPPGPSSVPPDLTAPSASYKRSAWLATLGLLGFLVVYLGLTGYFGWLVFRLLFASPSFLGVLSALPAMFFFGFLVRGLFVVKHTNDPYSVEVKVADEPRLFAFLYALADRIGAPRPHRVYISARVNAAVFYDLSFVNLLFPSKKNLEIGLGLVNALSLDELAAVLSHEYGHFAQRTMAVGRWVYVAQQIAGHIVMARTGFDRFLGWLSSTDLRVAWIGWTMRLLVWAIRAVLDTFLRGVLLAHRALGRQMELQADRVAVSVTGSDSIVHALHRLGPADEAWEEAVGLASEETFAGRPVADLFTLQSSALEHLRRIFDEPEFGQTPRLPRAGAPSSFRVFEESLASPPRMWSTHPSNREREDHAKLVYLPSVLDTRPAWGLFASPAALRTEVTRVLLAGLAAKQSAHEQTPAPAPPAPIDASLAKLAERFTRTSLGARYRGVYLGRMTAAYHASPASMMRAPSDASPAAILATIDASYPDELRGEIAAYRERRAEEMQLQGLADGVLTAPGGILRYRGRQIRRKDLPAVLDTVRNERRALEAKLVEHDVTCRSAHRDAARLLGGGWEHFLESLVALLHYATHTSRAIGDAHSHLGHVLDIVLADGSVSGRERRRLVAAATDLQDTLAFAWQGRAALRIPQVVQDRLDAEGGFEAFKGELGTRDPHERNIGDYLQVADGWARGASMDLMVLARVTLDTLLDAEHHVAESVRNGTELGPAPAPAEVPASYPTCVVGGERERQKRLGLWDRFQTADGILPGTARFVVASGLLLPTLLIGGATGYATIHVHNGLSTPVVVAIGDETVTVGAHATAALDHDVAERVHVTARTPSGGPIEAFDARIDRAFGDYAYNVAQAGALLRLTAVYGPGRDVPEQPVGAPRWLRAADDVFFGEPPESVSTSRGRSAVRTVLTAVDRFDADPALHLRYVTDPSQQAAMAKAHLAFEPLSSAAFDAWASASVDIPGALAILERRALEAPDDVNLQRAIYRASPVASRPAICARWRARAEQGAGDPDRRYLAIKCIEDVAARRAAFVEAYLTAPDHPFLAYAAAEALVQQARFSDAARAWALAARSLPVPSLRYSAVIESLRTHRAAVLAGALAPDAEWSPPSDAAAGFLAFLASLRAAPQPGEPLQATVLRTLHRGEPEAAAAAADRRRESPIVLGLAAASDGASPTLRARALALPVAEHVPHAMPAMIGLAIREGADPSPWLARLVRDWPDEPAFAAASEALRAPDAAPRPERLEAIAARGGPAVRGHVLSMGLVALGDAAPPAWRDEVQMVLFELERPYFRPGR